MQKESQKESTTHLNLVVEIAQLLAQFGVTRLALVVEAVLAALAGALVLAVAGAGRVPRELSRQSGLHR